jgi:hypothetical protein
VKGNGGKAGALALQRELARQGVRARVTPFGDEGLLVNINDADMPAAGSPAFKALEAVAREQAGVAWARLLREWRKAYRKLGWGLPGLTKERSERLKGLLRIAKASAEAADRFGGQGGER